MAAANAHETARIVKATDPRAIETAASTLKRGELVAMPTETVYGLAADATSPAAVGAIFLAKGRPRFNPLIVHVASVEEARAIVEFNPWADALAGAFWPGPLTMVLPRRPDAPIADLATAGLPTIAVRVPVDKVARALLAAFGGPIAAPSANRSGHVSATTAEHVAADVGGDVALILDGGPSGIGLESTIVGLEGSEPTLLRAGGVPRMAVEKVLGRTLTVPAVDPEAPLAPGMLTSHYAPAARLRLGAVRVEPGEGLLAFGPEALPGCEHAVATINLSRAGDLVEAASNFFAALRALDGQANVIAVAPIPEEGLGEAINDRLRRAAAPRQASVSSARA